MGNRKLTYDNPEKERQGTAHPVNASDQISNPTIYKS